MKHKTLEYYGTLGPSCINTDTLVQMFHCGMTGIRLNLSHKSLKDSKEWIRIYKDAAAEAGKEADLLIDLIGPEIRIGDLTETLQLDMDDQIVLIWDEMLNTQGYGTIPIPSFVKEHLTIGQVLLMDDGKIELVVEKTEADHSLCKVTRGGHLSSRKSLALPGCQIKNPPLTAQDHENLKHAAEYGVTAVMQPFVRGKEDLIELRNALKAYGAEKVRIFAKIENMEGVKKVEELLPYCDVIVIARGDLGNAMPLPKLPVVQQKISDICREADKPFMVVTQMLNSMIQCAVPTRAEVTDIFHAVQNGASSVMLTGETAAGQYPVEAMKVLVDTGKEALNYLQKEEL
ncbi:MAG: pyruvate kinase [Lachnospiraceae bacterium]|nr:pyruvate kinase [Lachnospiraceae bacterium]